MRICFPPLAVPCRVQMLGAAGPRSPAAAPSSAAAAAAASSTSTSTHQLQLGVTWQLFVSMLQVSANCMHTCACLAICRPAGRWILRLR